MQTNFKDNRNDLDKVMVADLRVGMHVCELDRPWLGTPFMFHAFRIRSGNEIELLQRCCDYVYVNRGDAPVDARTVHARRGAEYSPVSDIVAVSARGQGSSRYPDTVTADEETPAARKIFPQCHDLVSDIFEAAEREGSIDMVRVRRVTGMIVDSVLRNADAFMLLQNLKNRDLYRYRHAINCCSLAAVFCRFLGFTRDEIRDIALGAMLLDIGTLRLPGEMLEMKSPLSPLLQKLTRHHVGFGLDLLQDSGDIPDVVREMISTHHERMDGKGYPAGLRGEQIPVSGRIAAIVDSYDAMVNVRPYRASMTPAAAICELYKWRDVDFHPDLVEKFIQCIGAWPTGSLVELNSGQIGLVVAQNRVHRSSPVVLLVMDAGRACYTSPHTVELHAQTEKSSGRALEIRGAVRPEEVNINPADFCA